MNNQGERREKDHGRAAGPGGQSDNSDIKALHEEVTNCQSALKQIGERIRELNLAVYNLDQSITRNRDRINLVAKVTVEAINKLEQRVQKLENNKLHVEDGHGNSR